MASGGLAVVYTLAVLLLLLPVVLVLIRRPGVLNHAALWVVIFAALMWGYHFFAESPPASLQGVSPAPADPVPAPTPSDSPVRNL